MGPLRGDQGSGLRDQGGQRAPAARLRLLGECEEVEATLTQKWSEVTQREACLESLLCEGGVGAH